MVGRYDSDVWRTSSIIAWSRGAFADNEVWSTRHKLTYNSREELKCKLDFKFGARLYSR